MAKIINVKLNEKTIDYEVGEGESVVDLLYAINEFCDAQKLPPLKWMTVDSEKYDLELIPDNIDKPLDQVDNVEFQTYDPSQSSLYESKRNTYYIDETLSQIQAISPELENVASLLSAGSDSKAMEIIKDFSDIMESCINIFAVHGEVDGENVNQEFFENTNNILNDLTSAMENKDSILIGDLMEYEFNPIIQTLQNYLQKLK